MILGIFGAGGLGREIAELAILINKWDKIVFVVDNVTENKVNNLDVLSYDSIEKNFDKKSIEFIIAIGEPIIKRKICDRFKNKNYKFTTLIHPTVEVPNSTKIGQGVIVQKGCFIGPNVIISDNVLLQPCCCVGHDSIISKFSVISSFVSVCGHVNVGENTYIGVNAAIKQGIHIGSDSIIGMGSVVIKDIPNNVIAFGNPARPMKEKNDNFALK